MFNPLKENPEKIMTKVEFAPVFKLRFDKEHIPNNIRNGKLFKMRLKYFGKYEY